MEDLVGKSIGRYQITALLGQGGMATVYRAEDPRLRIEVAIKVLHAHMAANPSLRARFEREAHLGARLRHPRIARVFDVDTTGNTTYLVMEFIEGRTLEAVLGEEATAGRRLPLPQVLSLFAAVASGVDYAHQEGMVHRDIKPANIIITPRGEPVLTDYGIAHLAEATSYTLPGMVMGSAPYMSPEQAQGLSDDHRTDLYALGIMLFEALSGQVPFPGDTTAQILAQHVTEPVPDICELNPQLPPAVGSVIKKALAKDPAQRYQTAADLVFALRQALDTPEEEPASPVAAPGAPELSTPEPLAATVPESPAREPLAATVPEAPEAATSSPPGPETPSALSTRVGTPFAAPLPEAMPEDLKRQRRVPLWLYGGAALVVVVVAIVAGVLLTRGDDAQTVSTTLPAASVSTAASAGPTAATSEVARTGPGISGNGPWTDLKPSGDLPSARTGHSMVYDPATEKVIMFGGNTEGSGWGNDTWAYDPAANDWTHLKPSGDLPSARSGHSMIYDPATEKVIMFGGTALEDSYEYFNDIWAYDPAANTWSSLNPSGNLPAPRCAHSMVYDPATETVIMFGGFTEPWDALGDTWVYDPGANTWTELNPSGDLPAPRFDHSILYDPATEKVILFGGVTQGFDFGNDTWIYDPAANIWTELGPSGDPPPGRSQHSMVYDPATERVIVFWGWIGSSSDGGTTYEFYDDIWACDPAANTWAKLNPSGDLPPGRSQQSMVYEPATGRAIAFGGGTKVGWVNDTWAFSFSAAVPQPTSAASAITESKIREVVAPHTAFTPEQLEVLEYATAGEWCMAHVTASDADVALVVLREQGAEWVLIDIGTSLNPDDLRSQGVPDELMEWAFGE